MNRLLTIVFCAGITIALPAFAVRADTTCMNGPSGLIDWWPAESNADDVVGRNSGRIVGDVGFGAGMVSDAFILDAAGNEGVVVESPVGLGTARFTLCAWVRPASLPNSYPTILRRPADAFGDQFVLSLTSDGRTHFNVGPGVSGGPFVVAEGGSVPLGIWTHLGACAVEISSDLQ